MKVRQCKAPATASRQNRVARKLRPGQRSRDSRRSSIPEPGPDATVGCKSCSFLADTFDGASVHLPARDIAFAAVSRAQIANIQAFKQRMGWSFPWVSSFANEFNFDYGVSFREGDRSFTSPATYNYAPSEWVGEAPGASVFLRDGDAVFHTYSTYARGLDHLIATYKYINLTPIGRNEDDGMSWVRHHDKY